MKKVFILSYQYGYDTIILAVLSNREKIPEWIESFIEKDLSNKKQGRACCMNNLDFDDPEVIIGENVIEIYGDNGLFSIDIRENSVE